MTDQALIILKEKFGTEFGADAVKEVAAQLNTSYATLSKYLNQYKVSRGKWNLDATVQDLEETYNSPAVEGVATMSAVVQNLIPSSALVTLLMLKRLFNLGCFILPSLLVSLVMVKLLGWSNLVPNLVGNLFV